VIALSVRVIARRLRRNDMARYIDADKLIAHLKDEIKGCEPPFGSRANGKSIAYGTKLGLKSAISFAETLATADVVPKSEVEELKKKLAETEVELMNVCLEKTNCDDMIQYILDFYFRRKVMDVFEEIEFEIRQLDFDREETRAIAIEGIIAKCKKKYTEVNDEKQS
jgi:hypothetical protein